MTGQGLMLWAVLGLLGCAGRARPPESLPALRSAWQAEGALRFRLEVVPSRGHVSTPLSLALHIARERAGAERGVSLLAGRFVFVFVPEERTSGSPVHGSVQAFSGGGGIDYAGRTPLAFEVDAPAVPGRYWLFATVQSTPDDIRSFLVLARIHAGAGPWWVGNQSTLPVLVEVLPAPSDEAAGAPHPVAGG